MIQEKFRRFKEIQGAISVTEAAHLYLILSEFRVTMSFEYAADLGAHAGKSTSIASYALGNSCANFFLVDPLYDKDNPDVWKSTTGTSSRNYYFDQNDYNNTILNRAKEFNPNMNFFLEGIPSEEFLNKCPMLGYCFVDTDDHNATIIGKEIALLKEKMLIGGILAFHDYGNQFVPIYEAANGLVKSGLFEMVKPDMDEVNKLVDLVGGEKGNDSWHIYDSIPRPNFVGCFRRIK